MIYLIILNLKALVNIKNENDFVSDKQITHIQIV
jgi:hypothetical protein